MINVEAFLIENKQTFIQKIMSKVTSVHRDKCIRDLNLMYNAVVEDVSNNNSAAITRNASHFWHRGKMQVVNVDDKLRIHSYFFDELITTIQENIENCDNEVSVIKNLCTINEHIMRNGSYLSSNEQLWVDRRNFAKFDAEVEIPKYLENHLDTCILETPIQNDPSFLVFKLGPEDTEIKEFLTRYYYINRWNQHNFAVVTAPIVYMLIQNETVNVSEATDNHLRGISGGVMLAETLRYGYDFSFSGCVDAPIINKKRKKKWINMIKDRFNIDLSNYNDPFPNISWCIGRGIVEDHIPRDENGEKVHVYDILSNGEELSRQYNTFNFLSQKPYTLIS